VNANRATILRYSEEVTGYSSLDLEGTGLVDLPVEGALGASRSPVLGGGKIVGPAEAQPIESLRLVACVCRKLPIASKRWLNNDGAGRTKIAAL
jgi:hypothetical protein